MDNLYSFVYRGLLTEETLDKAGRQRRNHFSSIDAKALHKSLCYDFLDEDLLSHSHLMAIVYTAIHCFENMVRDLVKKSMVERYEETWWDKLPERIRNRVKTRMEEDAKFRWHGARGASELSYCDFGDLSSIIVTNWEVF